MLGKLLKYEIPALGRRLAPLYIGWAATAVLLGVSVGSANSKSEFMVVISGLLYTAAATAVVVMAVIMIVQRYSRSLLGDEAYFNQVLPVTASQHIASKTISALFWIVISGLVMLFTGLIIAVCSGDFSEVFDIAWLDLSGVDGNFWVLLAEFLICIPLSVTKSVLAIYAAITVGHQVQDHQTFASIGAYFGVLIFESAVGRMLIPLFGTGMIMTDSDILNTELILLIAIIVSIAIGAVYFFICKYLMERKLNLA